MKKNLVLASIALSSAICVLGSQMAQAHVTFANGTAAQGATYKGVLQIGHGCDGQATVKLRVQIPEGVIAVKPMPKPGWNLEIITGDYAKSYDYYGDKVSGGVKELVWSGDLPDAYYDEFVFRAKLTDAFATGDHVFFPVTQECASATESWTQIPAAGQNAHDLASPAPGIEITEPEHGHHH